MEKEQKTLEENGSKVSADGVCVIQGFGISGIMEVWNND